MGEYKETIKNKEKISIEDLRREISEIKGAHFDVINPDDFTETDLRMYKKILKEKTITHEEYFLYRDKLEEEVSKENDENKIKSRRNFIVYLGNKAMPLLREE